MRISRCDYGGLPFFFSEALPLMPYSPASNNGQTIGSGFIFLPVIILYLE